MSSEQCKGKLNNDKPCPREVVPGSEWCIFHYPNKKGERVEQFKRAFSDETKKQESKHPEYFDFTGFDFPIEMKFNENFKDVYFKSAVFRKDVSFGDVRKGKEIIFQGNANFNLAIFQGYTSFDDATFRGNVWFVGATFKGRVGFDNATFEGYAWFVGSIFEGDAFFSEIQLSAGLILNNFIIEKRFTLNPNYVEQTTNVDELNTSLVEISDPIIKQDGKMVISGNLGKVTSNLITGISLLDTDLTRVDFVDETWPIENGKPSGRKIIIDEVFLTRQIEQEIETPYAARTRVTQNQVAQTYRRIRKNYENAKRYSEAGDFLIGELEVTRKYRQGSSGASQRRPWTDPKRSLFSLYYALGKYGESIGIPLTWSIILILLAAELHTFLTWNPAKKTHILIQYINSLSKTILAFFPFSGLQDSFDFTIRSVGTLLLALIFIALRRKLERR